MADLGKMLAGSATLAVVSGVVPPAIDLFLPGRFPGSFVVYRQGHVTDLPVATGVGSSVRPGGRGR